MNNLLFIGCGTGLQAGLNPCIFMTCAVFIIYGLWLDKRFPRMAWLRIIFGLFYVLSVLIFDFGPGQIIILQKVVFLLIKIIYFILGMGTFVLGVLFFKDWLLLSRGVPANDLMGIKIKPLASRGVVIFLITLVLAVVLGAVASIWPINPYVMLLVGAAISKGVWQSVLPFALVYVFFSIWPLWFMWAFLSVKNLRPSFLKIFCASIFFTASSCMILLFK